MRNKKLLFISILLFMVVLSIGAASAQDADDAIASSSNDILGASGSVSGGVDVVTENPWNTNGELSYDIPADATTIKSADVYVNVYAGRADNAYGANANITIATDNNETKYSESLWIEDGSTDGTVYTVNDHTTKCYSDYMIHYDVTSMLDGLQGTGLKINVDTFEMANKSFDGRIKLIALVLAYDNDGDDSISYWVNDDQLWTKSNVTITFDTADVTSLISAGLRNVVLSSGDGTYMLNGEVLGDADTHVSGNYYQYNEWDVTTYVEPNQKTDLIVNNAGTGAYNSVKNVLSVLTVLNNFVTDVSISPEYTSVPTVYAGTNNTLTVKVTTTKAGKYSIDLLANGAKVDGKEIDLVEGENTILLTDPTIRPIDDTTVNGAENNIVDYAAKVSYNGTVAYNKEISVPVLYNGYLGYDMEYEKEGYNDASVLITGDVVIDVQDASTYLGASAMNRTDVWTVNLTEDDELIGATLLIPYNWFNSKLYNETADMFDLTFNGETIEAYEFDRDQGNLGNYGQYGYGYLEYDVTDLLNTAGDNTLTLNKVNPTPAVYPSVLFYLYNTKGGNFKEVEYLFGVDLLSNDYNKANRTVKSNINNIRLNKEEFESVMLYVLAASAQAGEGSIIINDNEFTDVWTGTSSSTDLFIADITDITEEFNNISFVATGSTILALPQFIVADYGYSYSIDSLKTEYTSVPTCYAGTNNTLTATITSSIAGEFKITLWADDEVVDTIMVNLTEGTNTVLLTDPTIRPIDETTVNGAENEIVTYEVYAEYDNTIMSKLIYVPVLYNGYLGYDMEYEKEGYNDASVLITGDVVIDIQDASTYLGASAMNRTDVWTVNLTGDDELIEAALIIPYNWFNSKLYNETADIFDLTFNGETIEADQFDRDQGNLGNYGQYGYGYLQYDVTDLLNTAGDNTLTLNKVNPTPAVYPSVLAYIYNTKGGNFKEVHYISGVDLLSNDYNKANRTVKSNINNIKFSKEEYSNVTLYVLAASAQAGEGSIIVNDEEFTDVWTGTSSSTDLFEADITDIAADGTNIAFVATGSTILALPQFIVADYGYSINIDSLKTEYTSVPTCYAGTNNTLTATISTSIAGEYDITLWADDEAVDTMMVNLTEGTNTVLLTDPTIRPIDETTVNGAENEIVTYAVELTYNNITMVESINAPVLYNGNLGYDMEYDVIGFEDFIPISFSGDIVIDIQDVSTYLGATAMNRTDAWAVELDDESEITAAFVYVPYNWFNAKSYVEDINMFNITFNGASITPFDWYRDQGNLGSYGQYGYGVLIYDVSDLIAAGDNSLVLNKVNPTPAVYPSALVYMYDTEGSTISKTAYILNGADLLSNANNVAKRTAKSDTEIDIDAGEILNATLYVFAASAQAGESNIVFNGNVYEDVWNGTSSTTDLFTTDVTDIINETNSISFVATGSTILALPQIIVTAKDIMNTSLITPNRIIAVADGISGYDYQFILKDGDGNALAGKEVLVSFNGKNQTVITDENGWGTATVKADAEGTYDVTVTFKGDGEYSGVTQTATIKLIKEKTQFVAPDRTVYVQQMSRGYTYSAILKDQNGRALANKKVLFKFNGQSIVTFTDENGYATVKLTAVEAGTYTVTIKFAGTASCYYETSTTRTIKVVRESTKLSVPDVTVKSSGAKKVTATLKSKSDNPVYGAKLTLTVDGKTYTATTDNSGIAVFNIDISKLGIFQATTKFADSRFFAATSTTSKVTIN